MEPPMTLVAGCSYTPGACTTHRRSYRNQRCSFENLPSELAAQILEVAASEGASHISTLRLICSEFKELVDNNIRSLTVRSWPPSCCKDLASRWPRVARVEVCQQVTPASPLPLRCKKLTAPNAYPLMDALSRLPALHTLHLGALDTNFRRARDFAVRLVANVARLPNLRSLDLSGSGVSQLPPSLLYACTSLTHLSLDSCRMKALPAGLSRLSGLVHLSAANSPLLQALPETVMARLTALTFLDVRGCKLQSLPQSLPHSLQHLSASSNRLTQLPQTVGQLRSLAHLDISDNQLRNLSSLALLTGLTRLQVGSNWALANGSLQAGLSACMPALVVLEACGIGLKSLPSSFTCPKLEEIHLSSNDLAEVPSCLKAMSSLRSLSLDYNELTALPDWLGQLTTLTSLDVSGNALPGLPENLAGLGQSLLTLMAASNALCSLPTSFSRLSNLAELDLSDNKLGPLSPPVVWELPKLSLLAMASNGLQCLDDDVGRLRLLRWLDVSDNDLEALPLQALLSSMQLEVLKISGNKLEVPEDLPLMTSWPRQEAAGTVLGQVGTSMSPSQKLR